MGARDPPRPSGTYTITAEPFRVSPPEAVVYLNGINTKRTLKGLSRYNNSIWRRNMSRKFSVIIERDTEGYYVGTIPELRGCHSQARSLDELMIRIREAAELCLEAQMDGWEPLDFVGVQTISVAV
jgi:predicted RNase H-like HicB family nuclease